VDQQESGKVFVQMQNEIAVAALLKQQKISLIFLISILC